MATQPETRLTYNDESPLLPGFSLGLAEVFA